MLVLAGSPYIDPGKPPHRPVSLGAVYIDPESVGGYVSFWPDDGLAVDLKGTLSTVDFGVTGLLPITTDAHNLAISAALGYAHSPQHNNWLVGRSVHLSLLTGYAYEGNGWDIRALLGVDRYAHVTGFSYGAMVGRQL